MLNFWSWEKKQQVSKKLLQFQSLFSASKSSIQSSLASIDGTFCSEAKKRHWSILQKGYDGWNLQNKVHLFRLRADNANLPNFLFRKYLFRRLHFCFWVFWHQTFQQICYAPGFLVGTCRSGLKLRSKWHILWVSKRQSHHQWLPWKGKINTKRGVGSLPYLKKNMTRTPSSSTGNRCWSYILFSRNHVYDKDHRNSRQVRGPVFLDSLDPLEWNGLLLKGPPIRILNHRAPNPPIYYSWFLT